jgi:hypothetical protein
LSHHCKTFFLPGRSKPKAEEAEDDPPMGTKGFMANAARKQVDKSLSQLLTEFGNEVASREQTFSAGFPCNYPALVLAGDRSISTEGRMINISSVGITVDVKYPRKWPPTVILHDLANNEIYECQVKSNTGRQLTLQCIDILGPARRQKFLTGEKIPMRAR